MDDKNGILFVSEANASRLERTIVRMWIVIILLILLLVGTNIGWIYYENQFTDVETTVTQDVSTDNGGNAYVFDGVHYNGESETDSQN